MAVGRRLVVGGLAMLLGGCTQFGEPWSERFGLPPPPTPTPTAESDEVFYAATEGLALHALPSGSSQIVARLALHQRVTRLGIARGYANVTTDSGLVGWVDNAQLLWRLPAPPETRRAPAVSPASPPPTATGAD